MSPNIRMFCQCPHNFYTNFQTFFWQMLFITTCFQNSLLQILESFNVRLSERKPTSMYISHADQNLQLTLCYFNSVIFSTH